MKNRHLKIISVFLVFALASGCLLLSGCGKKQTLNLYTWQELFPQEILSAFTKKTGIEINYVNFDLDETMLAKLEAAEGGDYDLIIADDYIVEQAIAEGLVQKLDKSKLKNYSNCNPVFMGQFYDPKDEYTVPYGAGIIEIVYRPEKVGFEIKGYSDLWDESLAGRVGIIGNYRVIDGIALKCLGYSFNTENPEELAEAAELLNRLAPNIRLINDEFLNDDLVSGEIDAAIMYTSQGTLAATADDSVRIVLPDEGLGFGIMPMFIPSKAPNADAAHKFIDFILDGQNAAACFEYMGYYSTNSAADKYISEAFRPFITLPDRDIGETEMIQNVSGETLDIHEEMWNSFKKNCK